MKNKYKFVFLLLIFAVLIQPAKTFFIPKNVENFLQTLFTKTEKIVAANQEEDFLFAQQWNDKFDAVNQKIIDEFGFIPARTEFQDIFIKGEIIESARINAKFNAYVSALLEIEADPDSVSLDPILETDFQEKTLLDVSLVNQKFIALNNLIDTTVNLPNKVVVSGETWVVSAGSTQSYTNITVNSGGTIQLVGSGVAVIEAKREFILNGSILGASQTSSINQSVNIFDQIFSDNKAKQPSGSSSGNANGSDGKHGVPLVLKAKNLSGTGSINLSGENGGTGSPGNVTRTCVSGFSLINVSSDCGGTRYTCLRTGKSIGNSCSNSNACNASPNACASGYSVSKANIINKILNSLNNQAFAGGIGGGPICIPISCTTSDLRKPSRFGSANRGGGGSGGNGGNLWIMTQTDNSSLSINLNSGSGGGLNSFGTGGTIGSNGLAGIVQNISF